jgi:hypothetical protein
MTTRQWQTILGMLAAVNGVLLAQELHPDVVFPPIVMLGLLCVNVALAFVRPSADGPKA